VDIPADYDRVAEAYAAALSDELRGKPLDRWLLERIAAEAPGPILEIGCGPGHIAAFLADHGATVQGANRGAVPWNASSCVRYHRVPAGSTSSLRVTEVFRQVALALPKTPHDSSSARSAASADSSSVFTRSVSSTGALHAPSS
jgi:hypothetical protein